MTVSIVRGGASNDSNSGYQQILSAEQEPQVGLTFGVWRLEPGRAATLVARDSEIAALVFSGSGSLAVNGHVIDFDRREWLETAPTVVHCCAGDSIEAASRGDQTAEIFVVQAPNPNRFAPRFYRRRRRSNRTSRPGHPAGHLPSHRPACLRRYQRSAGKQARVG